MHMCHVYVVGSVHISSFASFCFEHVIIACFTLESSVNRCTVIVQPTYSLAWPVGASSPLLRVQPEKAILD